MKIKKEKGDIMLLDITTEYLCGPWFGFYCNDMFHLFKNCDKDNPYELINLKAGDSVSRLTVEFSKVILKSATDKSISSVENNHEKKRVAARLYADVYFSKDDLNCLFFYSIGNVSRSTLKSVRIFNLFDFDIGGLNYYDTDYVNFDPEFQAIIQHDNSVFTGFASIPDLYPVSHFAGGHPYELEINEKHPSLSDVILEGPDDFFSGLEWNLGDLEPNEIKTIPVIMAAGESRNEFYKNLEKGIEKARRLLKTIERLVKMPERQQKISEGLIDRFKMIEKLQIGKDGC